MCNLWAANIEYLHLEDRVRVTYQTRIARRRVVSMAKDFAQGFRQGFMWWLPAIKAVWIAGLLLLLLRYASLWLAALE